MVQNMLNRHNVSEKEAWDDQTHAEHFDFLSTEPNWILKKYYESLSEGKLLKMWKPHKGKGRLFEVGCALGTSNTPIGVRHFGDHLTDHSGIDW